ncbi:DUF2478 domain-containing protein [Loktanella sp. IMCC34160]|uniref:DUF2478 domain-containing protein n=1 Tax=Loktanella sp. IMCC34160 TaxID=2510646 RepID=UPI00101B9BDE|nr:DUF2478 domain-containing protein [Loktanella sp. IMCC34160]RYG89293.1 DUF2478 domain-containing protein [Loktanella sp. IMCC34160]
MKIGYSMAPGRGDTDLMLHRLASALLNRGLRVAGTVQVNSDRPDDGPCDMDVKVLPDGPVIRISQSLGDHSKGCRLDPSALEQAVGHVEASLGADTDLLIINKFGKHEAEGRGFRAAIANALALDVPVIVGTNGLNKDAFVEFTGELAEEIAPSFDALQDWCLEQVGVLAEPA